MLVSIESHKPHSVAGLIIAWATRSVWCHTAVIVKDGYGTWRYEALVGEGFVKKPWKYRVGVYETVLNLDPETSNKLVLKLEKMVGTKYPSVGWMALAYALPIFRDMKRRLYCSQAALEALKAAGLYEGKFDARFNSKPSPGVLYFIAETLAARPDLRKLGE